MNFPLNLKNARLEKSKQTRAKVTQVKLAKDLGLTRSMVASYEQGVAEPCFCVLLKMSEYFNTDIDSLIR